MTKLNTLGARIEWALNQKKMAASTASLKLGWSISYLSKLISGEIIGMDFLRGVQLAEFLNVDPVWLATGEMRSEILLVKAGQKHSIADNPNSPLLANYVPLLSWQEAGKRYKSAYDIKDKRTFPMVQMTANAGLGAFALIIDGDSMIDSSSRNISFYKDDIVFFCPDESPQIGCYVLARLPNENSAMFRRLVIDCDKLYLMPHNKQYPAIELKDKNYVFAVAVERSTRLANVNTSKRKMQRLDELL
jgi:SOS-response transcriptional repressor LexA